MSSNKGPRILILDIETSPIISYTWGLFDQNVSLDQIKQDWHIISYAAKWVGEDKVFYRDQRGKKNITDDSALLLEIRDLLDQCDILLTQNGVSFDHRKINARLVINNIKPPSPYRHIDTFRLAKKYFAFTSHKLEYMTKTLNKKYKKLKHTEFAGFSLWVECLKGNLKAWNIMKKYNIYDVLSLEELYDKLKAWDTSIDFNVYTDDEVKRCSCGSTEFNKKGFFYTNTGKFQRYTCSKCGAHTRSKTNLLSKDKKASLKA